MRLIDKIKVISAIVLGLCINISTAMMLDKFMNDSTMMITFILGILAILTIIAMGTFIYAIAIEKQYESDQFDFK